MAAKKKAAANRKGAVSRPTKGRSGSPKPKSTGRTRKTVTTRRGENLTITSKDGVPVSYETWNAETGRRTGKGNYPLG